MKPQIFFATMTIICVIFYIDTYRTMYDPIFDIDGIILAGLIFMFCFIITSLMPESKK